MLTIGSDELGDEIEEVTCPHCGEVHPIEYGTSRTLQYDGTWSEPKPSKMLGYYKCGGKTYLASIEGRAIKPTQDF